MEPSGRSSRGPARARPRTGRRTAPGPCARRAARARSRRRRALPAAGPRRGGRRVGARGQRTRTPSTRRPSRWRVRSRSCRPWATSAARGPTSTVLCGCWSRARTGVREPRCRARGAARPCIRGRRSARRGWPPLVDDRPRAPAEATVALEEGTVACAREEAEVLGVATGGDRQAALAASSRTCGLCISPSGKRRRASELGAGAEST